MLLMPLKQMECFLQFDDNGDCKTDMQRQGPKQSKSREAYNAAVGKPAGYLAITRMFHHRYAE